MGKAKIRVRGKAIVALAIAIILPKKREEKRGSFDGKGKIGQRYCNHGANNGLQTCWLVNLKDLKAALAGMLSGLTKHRDPFVGIRNKAGKR